MRVAACAFLLLLAATAAPSPAQEPAPEALSLSRAIEVALERNHQLGAANAAVGVADARIEEARSYWLPRVEISETLTYTTNPVYVFGNLLGQEAFGPANFDTAYLNEPDPLSNFNTRLTVAQPIWTGGKLTHSRDAATLARDAAAASRDRTRQEVVRQVVDAYTGAVLAEAYLQVAREARDTARAHVGLVENLREGGLVVASDLLQARVRESEVEEMVLQAESAVATARAGLNLTMGLGPSERQVLPPSLEVPPRAGEELAALVAEALERRPDLAAATTGVQAASEGSAAAKAGLYPEIGFWGAYEANEENYPGAQGTNWTLMATARFTLFDGSGVRARVRQADEDRRRAEEQAALLRQAVEMDVIRAFHDLRAAEGRLEEARRSVEFGREGLRIIEDRYREGLTTLVELLDAETALTRARAREVGAHRDLLLSRAGLDLAVGRL